MIKGLHHAGLSVANLEAAIGFYQTADAFKVALRFDIPNTEATQAMLGVKNAAAKVALLQGPTGFLELFEFESPKPRDTKPEVYHAGLRHICIQAVDGNRLYDAFVATGAQTHARPSGLGTGNLYCYIRDLENNIIELEGLPYAGKVKSDPWFAHVALVTADLKRLSAFYSQLTGNKVHSQGNFGPDPKLDVIAGIDGIILDAAWIKAGGLTIEMWQYHKPVTEPAAAQVDASCHGWSHFALEVDDIEAEYARLCALGVPFHAPPASTGKVKFVYGRDPDGNIFELIQALPGPRALSIDTLVGHDLPSQIDRLVAAFYRSAAQGQSTAS